MQEDGLMAHRVKRNGTDLYQSNVVLRPCSFLLGSSLIMLISMPHHTLSRLPAGPGVLEPSPGDQTNAMESASQGGIDVGPGVEAFYYNDRIRMFVVKGPACVWRGMPPERQHREHLRCFPTSSCASKLMRSP